MILSLGVVCLMGCSGITSAGNPVPSSINKLQIQTETLPSGTINASYNASLTATGGVPPYTWHAVGGQLPAGLTLNATTGGIGGTPVQAGSFSFAAQVQDSHSDAASHAVGVSIGAGNSPLQLTTTYLPVGSINGNYNASLTATGGAPPYSWSKMAGQLPPGVTLSAATGTIAGTPSQAGTFSFTAQVTDSKAANASGGLSLNVSTAAAPTITMVSPNTGATAGGTSVSISGSSFQPGATVNFGSAPAVSVRITNSTQIQVLTPAESAGSVNVSVTNPDGQVATGASTFIFSAPTGSGPSLPKLPASVNLPLPFPGEAGYTVMNVTPGQLQSAINTAAQACASDNGVVLQLPTGDVETGNFTLPLNNCRSGEWIIITTGGVTPPQGSRIDPSQYVGRIARLTGVIAGGVIVTASDQPVSNYWLSGLEIEEAAANGFNEAVDIGIHSSSPGNLPSNIVIDRCYIHGKASNPVSRLVDLNGNNVAIVDSYLSEGHEIGFDAQGILTAAGGPMLIRNNFIEGAGENIMFGGASNGADQPPYDDFSHDVTVQQNFIYKPVAWFPQDPAYMGIHYTAKNLYEMKSGMRVAVQDNVLENSWGDAQAGEVAIFQAIASQSGLNAVIDDVTFNYNYSVHAGEGLIVAGEDPTIHPPDGIQRQHRILIQNNVLDDINAAVWQGTSIGQFGFQMGGGADGVTIDHNTFPYQSAPNKFVLWANDDRPETNFYFTNNIDYVPAGGGGLVANGGAEGTSSIQSFLSGTPAGSVTSDILIGGNCTKYLSGFQCPSSASGVDFVNYNNGNGGDYRLCRANGTPAGCTKPSLFAAGQRFGCQNNTDCGANISQLKQNISGVAVFPLNVPSISSLSATSMLCNGTNTLTINGSNLNLQGTEVLVSGSVVSQSNASAASITIKPPVAVGVTVPVTVDNFGLPATISLTCR